MKINFINVFEKPNSFEIEDWGGCSAIVLNYENKICMIRTFYPNGEKENRWSLPGGGKEVGETPEECIRREIMEEAQLEVKDLKFLMMVRGEVFNDDGSKLTDPEELKKYKTHIRFICRAKDIGEFVPHKDGFETVERKFVDVGELPNYYSWMSNEDNGREFYEFLKTKI